eukprot:1729725-Rhodomonas_salina.1
MSGLGHRSVEGTKSMETREETAQRKHEKENVEGGSSAVAPARQHPKETWRRAAVLCPQARASTTATLPSSSCFPHPIAPRCCKLQMRRRRERGGRGRGRGEGGGKEDGEERERRADR